MNQLLSLKTSNLLNIIYYSVLGIVICFCLLSLVSVSVSATSQSEACDSIGGTYDNASKTCSTKGTSINSAITAIINTISNVAGIVAVVMLVFGGFRYITSNGDANSAKNARNTIMFALIGITLVVLAKSIVQYVLNKV